MLAEILTFCGLLIFGGLLGVISGVSLARLGRRGEALPQVISLAPWWVLLGVMTVYSADSIYSSFLPHGPNGFHPLRLLATAIVLFGVLVSYRILEPKPQWFQNGQVRRRFSWAVRVWAVGMFGFIGVVLLNNFLLQTWLPGSDSSNRLEGLNDLTLGQLAASLLLVCVVMPVLEEMFFRGYLFRGLAGPKCKLSPVRALAFSSLAFALAHGPGMWIPAFYLGCLLAWLDWRGADLRLCMMAHIAHNSFFFTLALI